MIPRVLRRNALVGIAGDQAVFAVRLRRNDRAAPVAQLRIHARRDLQRHSDGGDPFDLDLIRPALAAGVADLNQDVVLPA